MKTRRRWVLGAVAAFLLVLVGLLGVWVLRGGAVARRPDTSEAASGGGASSQPQAEPRAEESGVSESLGELDEIVAEERNRLSRGGQRLLAARQALPPHRWHVERVNNIRKEGVKELIANLANFDDLHFATTSYPRPFADDKPACVSHMLPNLFRVRRLLEIGRAAPDRVVPALGPALRRALDQWPELYKKELWGYKTSAPEVINKSAPNGHDQARVRAEAVTYLLAELGRHESLPLLLESYRRQDRWIQAITVDDWRYIAQCPVPPPIQLYAMHRLITTLPDEQVPATARGPLRRYMQWARKHVPPVVSFRGTRPHAAYDESDPRNRIMDPKGVLVAAEPKMALTMYPTRFRDGKRMQAYHAAPYLTKKGKEWARLSSAVIEAAFPTNADGGAR